MGLAAAHSAQLLGAAVVFVGDLIPERLEQAKSFGCEPIQAILHDKVQIAKAVNATVISLDEAPKAYEDLDKGAAKKFVLDPHGLVKA